MSRSKTLNDDKGTQVSVQPKEPAHGAADMKTEHISSEDGQTHRIDIDGLNVWIFRDGAQWIAHGIEIDYAVAAETQEQAKSLFSVGLMMSLIENVRRFGNV